LKEDLRFWITGFRILETEHDCSASFIVDIWECLFFAHASRRDAYAENHPDLENQNVYGWQNFKKLAKKEGHKIALGPFIIMKVKKPPEGNSFCGGTGRKK
jgi:hypothetical protein